MPNTNPKMSAVLYTRMYPDEHEEFTTIAGQLQRKVSDVARDAIRKFIEDYKTTRRLHEAPSPHKNRP
jgi:Mn-dependent DtxR family transcriptional regulator